MLTCERNMMIQTQAWSRLSQEPSAEPAGHSKKVWMGKAGVLITKKVKTRKNMKTNSNSVAASHRRSFSTCRDPELCGCRVE